MLSARAYNNRYKATLRCVHKTLGEIVDEVIS